MVLIKEIKAGKRPKGWIVSTNQGNALVVRRTVKAMILTTKKSEFVSVNESAANEQAGWGLDDDLVRAMKSYKCTRVVVFVTRPGVVYETDAQSYITAGVVYMARPSKTKNPIRCVGIQNFTRRQFRAKV